MGDFKRRFLIELSIAIGLVVFLMGLLFLIGWDLSRRAGIADSRRSELTYRNLAISSLASLKKDATEAERYFGILENVLPQHDQLIDFSKELNSAARSRNLGFSFAFKSEREAQEDRAGAASFAMSLQGKTDQVLDFIRFIERSRFLVKLTSFDFSRFEDGFRAAINGEVFFR